MPTPAHLALLRDLLHRPELHPDVLTAVTTDIADRATTPNRLAGLTTTNLERWLARTDLTPSQRDNLLQALPELHVNNILGLLHTPDQVTAVIDGYLDGFLYEEHMHSVHAFLDHPGLTVADTEHLAAHG